MTTATQFVQQAATHIGYTESPAGSNCNQFSHSLSRPCEAWCADFLVAVARATGVALPSESAYTPTMWKAFQTAGRSATVPKTGAFAFFHFPGESAGVDHVGVVETWTASAVTTIDGNTSNGGSQVNGGAVERRTRSRNLVVGYGIPQYDTTSPTPPPTASVTHHQLGGRPVSRHLIPVTLDDGGNGYTPSQGPSDIPYGKVLAVTAHAPLYPPRDGKYGSIGVAGHHEEQGTLIVEVTGGLPRTTVNILVLTDDG